MAEHPFYDTPHGKITQLERKLAEAGLDVELIDAVNKKRGLAKAWVDDLRQRLNPPVSTAVTGQFDRYQRHLLSLDAQLDRLRKFDITVWNDCVATAGWFDGVDTSSDHVQRPDNLEFFYVEFGSPQENVELHWKAIAMTQRVPSDGGCYIKTGLDNLRLHPLALTYTPGIHRVRINLVANWEPKDGRSLVQVRERAAAQSKTLAHAETLAAYGLHDELLRQQDGENFPYADLSGFEYKFPGNRGFSCCPYVYRGDDGFRLYASGVGDVFRSWAAPVVLGVKS